MTKQHEQTEECLHNHVESNMCPETCRDCGKVLQEEWEDRFQILCKKMNIREETVSGFGEQAYLQNFILSELARNTKETTERVLRDVKQRIDEEINSLTITEDNRVGLGIARGIIRSLSLPSNTTE